MVFNGISFYLSFVYGFPDRQRKSILWERIERTAINRSGKWFIMGDFNELLHNGEKTRGNVRSESSFYDFRQMIRTCNFSDVKTVGNRYSWAGQRVIHYVTSCLDRTMGNIEWHDQFPSSETHFLELGESDHIPLITFFEGKPDERHKKFIYDDRLKSQEGFRQSVTRQWNRPAGLGQSSLLTKLQHSRSHIAKWKREHQCNSREKIVMLRNQLDEACTNGYPLAERKRLHGELQQAYVDEEYFWKIKS